MPGSRYFPKLPSKKLFFSFIKLILLNSKFPLRLVPGMPLGIKKETMIPI
jgi:hypothetical protein